MHILIKVAFTLMFYNSVVMYSYTVWVKAFDRIDSVFMSTINSISSVEDLKNQI